NVFGKVVVKDSPLIDAALAKYISEGDAPVHLIIELAKDLTVPMDIAFLAKDSPMNTEKMGHSMVIGGNGILRFMAQTVAHLIHAKAHMVNSEDEAYKKLQEIDSSLPPL